MILVDANLLLYAYDSLAPQHGPARRWVEEALSGPEQVGLPWPTLLAFLRIATNARILARPLSTSEAAAIVSEWLAQPAVCIVSPGERHWEILGRLLHGSKARGPLVMDAHLAALAIEHGATLCSTDRDFRRFDGLRLLDPLQSS